MDSHHPLPAGEGAEIHEEQLDGDVFIDFAHLRTVLIVYVGLPYSFDMASPRVRTEDPAVERKTERIELRVTPSAKALIQRAAAVSGLTAGELAYEAAQRVIESHEVMRLSEADALMFFRALENPPEPSERLVEAFRRRRARD